MKEMADTWEMNVIVFGLEESTSFSPDHRIEHDRSVISVTKELKHEAKINACRTLQDGNDKIQVMLDHFKQSKKSATHSYICINYEKQVETGNSRVSWFPINHNVSDNLIVRQHDDKGCDVLDLKGTSNKLHCVADSLPAAGAIVNVFLWPPNGAKNSNDILFLGALRRLRDWHNAHFTIFDEDSTQHTEFLMKFLSATIFIKEDDFIYETDNLIWRGKVSIYDKIESKGVTVHGVSLHCLDEESPSLSFPLAKKPTDQHDEKEYNDAILGRKFEVLDEIHLCSVPGLFKTSHTYKLCLYQKHIFSQVLMNYILQKDGTGLLARIAVYPDHQKMTFCEDVSLSTEAWKENLIADIQFVQEPEEEYQDNYEYLYFIFTSPDKYYSAEIFVVHAHLLCHPCHLNAAIATKIYHQTLCPVLGDDSTKLDFNNLKLFNMDLLKEVEADILHLQQIVIQTWLDHRNYSHDSLVVDEELLSTLKDVRLRYMIKLTEKLPHPQFCAPLYKLDLMKLTEETNDNTFEWPERLIQQVLESQNRSLTRMQSSESMPVSSPMQNTGEATICVDIENFLKLFHPDGSAAVENLSPVRKHPSRAKIRLSKPDVNNLNLLWPESKELISHDVYYNVDKKSEKVNMHMNKIREKVVRQETFSSCSSPGIFFPKSAKLVQSPQNVKLLRSPRKQQKGSMPSVNIPVVADTKNQRSQSTRMLNSTVNNKDHPRWLPPLQTIPSSHCETNNQSTFGLLQQRMSNKRITRTCSTLPLPHQVKNLQRKTIEDLSLVTSHGQMLRRESRSERHKRKLQKIVDSVLQANGVYTSDAIYKSCSSRLYQVTKVFVMDLPNSRNLKEEMRKMAESQVKQVIEVDKSRQHPAKNKTAGRQTKKSA